MDIWHTLEFLEMSSLTRFLESYKSSGPRQKAPLYRLKKGQMTQRSVGWQDFYLWYFWYGICPGNVLKFFIHEIPFYPYIDASFLTFLHPWLEFRKWLPRMAALKSGFSDNGIGYSLNYIWKPPNASSRKSRNLGYSSECKTGVSCKDL